MTLSGNQQPDKMDFSAVGEKPTLKKWPFVVSKILKFLGVVIGLWLLALLVIGLLSYKKIKSIYEQALIIRDLGVSAQHNIVNRNLAEASGQLKSANSELIELQKDFITIPLVRWTPWLGSQVKAVDDLIVAGINLTSSGAALTQLGDELTKDLKNESIPYAQLSKAKKKELAGKIVGAQPMFIQIQSELKIAALSIEKISADQLLPQLKEIVLPLQQYLPVISKMVDQAVPMISVGAKLTGFEAPVTYLFLIQNNHELRPTGGFIGTIGVLTLDSGDIAKLATDNVYNLDRAFQDDKLTLTPQQQLNESSPPPIARYLEQKQWALRDSNWDPDFPSSARLAMDFYNKEMNIAAEIEKQVYLRSHRTASGFIPTYQAEDFDGVMALTPELIENLLKITGPITVDGIRFTAENLQEELEYRVGFEYRTLGIPESARKDIIGKLAEQIKLKISSLPYTRLVDVFNVITDSFTSKAIQIYFVDQQSEKLVLDRGFGGEIATAPVDYLMVIDSNLGSLKSDQYIERFVDYKIDRKKNEVIGTVMVTHKHNGEFAWNSTRLRSYTRIYAPLGSQLISASGTMLDDKTKDPQGRPGQVDVYDEHGKTVFGAFFSTEPKETNSFTLVYRLPSNVLEGINGGSYSLLFQKQAGTNHWLTVNLDFGKSIKSAMPPEDSSEFYNNTYKSQTLITSDSWYTVKF